MSLSVLDELERRYDGPIPEPERMAWRYGSAKRADWIAARAQVDFFRTRVTRQIAILRARRDAGTETAELLEDLALYRRQWRAWRQALHSSETPHPLPKTRRVFDLPSRGR